MELDHADHEALLSGNANDKGVPLYSRTEHKDRFFATLFFGNLCAVACVALVLGVPNASKLYFTIHTSGTTTSHGVRLFLVFILTSCIGALASAAWLQILQRYAAHVITNTLRLSIVALVVLSLMAFHQDSLSGRAIGFFNLFVALSVVLYYARIRDSMAFAASNLSMASRILNRFPNVIRVAYAALAAQVVWVLIWSVALLGVLAIAVQHHHDSGSFGNVCFVLMLLSLFWCVQVARNTMHCITAGVVGEWWFGFHDNNTIVRSQTRALTTSFGSICLGSLILAALNTLQTLLLSTSRRKGTRSANACLECIVRFVSRNVQYFNRFAFSHVAIYGSDFQTAGQETMRLFRDRGWTVLINDNLIGMVLSVGCLLVGIASGVVGSAWAHLALRCSADEAASHPYECETFNVVVLTFVACASIGYAMCSIVSTILESLVATIVVCFANDPAALASSNPDEHTQLVDAWSRLRPELLYPPASLAASSIHV